MRLYSPFQKVVVLTCAVVFAASCASGKKDAGEATAVQGSLSNCPPNGVAGETIACQMPKGFTSDSSCFFDQGKASYYLNCSETPDGKLSITLSAQIGIGDLIARQGTGEEIIQSKFSIVAPTNAASAGPSNGTDEEITPGTSSPTTSADCSADSDCIIGKSCVGGKCVNSGATAGSGTPLSTTPPATTAPQELKVTLEAQDELRTRLGLYTFSFHVEGGQGLRSVALVGPWNRSEKHTTCDYELGTWLTTNPAKNGGGDFAPIAAGTSPSPNFQDAESKGLTKGTLCQRADDCYAGFPAPAAGVPVAPTCLMNPVDANGKPLTSGTFASGLWVQSGKFVIVATDEAGTVKKAELTLTAAPPALDPVAPSSESVQVTVDPGKPQIDVTAHFSHSIDFPQVSTTAGACVLDQSQSTGRRDPVTNTLKPNSDGSGSGVWTCPLSPDQQDQQVIQVTAVGIGLGNIKQESYQVTFEAPTVDLRPAGGFCDDAPTIQVTDMKTCEYKGTQKLVPTVSRYYDISKNGGASVKSAKPVVWVGSLNVYPVFPWEPHDPVPALVSNKKFTFGNQTPSPNTSPAFVSNAKSGEEIQLSRDHDRMAWVAEAKDWDGKTYKSPVVSFPYIETPFAMTFPQDPALKLTDNNSCRHGSSSLTMNWTGGHIRQILYHCEALSYNKFNLPYGHSSTDGKAFDDVETVFFDIPSPDKQDYKKNYGPSMSGTLNINKQPIPSDEYNDEAYKSWKTWKQDFTCEIKIVYVDGTTMTYKPSKPLEWQCGCESFEQITVIGSGGSCDNCDNMVPGTNQCTWGKIKKW